MEYKFVNIGEIEELILAKVEIDNYLISIEEIDKKYELNEFINKYAILDTTFVKDNNMIPFKLCNLNNKCYIFFNGDDYSRLEEILNSIDFDMSKLHNVTTAELIESVGNIDKAEYFIMDGKTYIV